MTQQFARHPRMGHAIKVAVAAALAWTVAILLPGPANDYPYYAPFGAVIAVTSTVAGSIRESGQGVLAILLGAAIARTFDLSFGVVLAPSVLTVAVVVAVAALVAGWRRLGTMGTWVPASAVFVLIIGNDDPVDFILAYGGLTTLGAAIGVGVLLLFPPLPLTPAQTTLTTLRETLADQLCDLADGLLQQQPLSQDDWEERRWAIEPASVEMRATIQQIAEARRGNRRLTKFKVRADLQYEQARALERLTFLVEDLTLLVAESERDDTPRVALGPELRPAAAAVMQRVADVLRSIEGPAAGEDELRAADEALGAFVDAVRDTRVTSEEDLFVAGSIVVSLRRCLASVVPAGLIDTIPSR